ncbi:MAG: glycosyltransferase family 4 protein, partial [Vicinamibacteraceae bacterium]
MTPTTPVLILYCEGNVDGTVGGSYYSLLFLVKGLDRARYRPLVVFYSEHSLLPAFRDAGIETLVWPRPKPFNFGSRARGPLALLRPLLLVAQKGLNVLGDLVWPAIARVFFLKRRGIRLVHLNNTILRGHDWLLAAKVARVPAVVHERGINDRYSAAAKYFGRSLGAIVCISEAVRDNMAARGADFGNLVTIPNGLDPGELRFTTTPAALRATFGLSPDAPVLGMIGNIKSWKGQETLVRAIDTVRQQCPDVRCLLIGATSPADEPYERELKALIAARGLDQHVIFTGFQKNVADFVAMVDIVVHASVLPEPFGRVVLEAMACRKPVIGARAGAIPEIVDEGVTGLTFPPGDAERLAEAILALVQDPARARRMGEAGYERLVATFHIQRNAEATASLYERLLGAAH